jgi:sulfofructose kinase
MGQTALCVGQASVELVGAIPRYPVRLGDVQELSAFALQGGGAAANAAATLARLGAKALFGGILPDDYLGDFAYASLVDAGVDVTHLRRQSGGVAPVAFVALDEEKKRRTVFFTRGDCLPLRTSDVPASALDGVELLLVDGSYPDAQLQLVRIAKDKGVKTLLTAHSMVAGMTQLAAVCDAVLASEGFARELSPLVPRSLQEILSLGASVAVVTLGEDGCVGQARGSEPIRVEPPAMKVVDPTGAGDVFRGAFAFSWMRGDPLDQQMRFAAAAATLKCRYYGAREGIPELAEVERTMVL